MYFVNMCLWLPSAERLYLLDSLIEEYENLLYSFI